MRGNWWQIFVSLDGSRRLKSPLWTVNCWNTSSLQFTVKHVLHYCSLRPWHEKNFCSKIDTCKFAENLQLPMWTKFRVRWDNGCNDKRYFWTSEDETLKLKNTWRWSRQILSFLNGFPKAPTSIKLTMFKSRPCRETNQFKWTLPILSRRVVKYPARAMSKAHRWLSKCTVKLQLAKECLTK